MVCGLPISPHPQSESAGASGGPERPPADPSVRDKTRKLFTRDTAGDHFKVAGGLAETALACGENMRTAGSPRGTGDVPPRRSFIISGDTSVEHIDSCRFFTHNSNLAFQQYTFSSSKSAHCIEGGPVE